MDTKEAALLVSRCKLGNDLPAVRSIASLWAGMGAVYEISTPNEVFVAKRIRLPSLCSSVGDERKRLSYDVEAAFYSQGHAEALFAAGCQVPRPLLVERNGADGLTICMTKLDGRRPNMGVADSRAALIWLAKLHAMYWGQERADAAVASGLQQQGCYWYLDTRTEEWERMSSRGMEGRLKLAAKAIDKRLKECPLQTICHGDAKDANMISMNDGRDIGMYDFQYCGKAPCTKDLAYFFTCASEAVREEKQLLEEYVSSLSSLLEEQGDTPPTMASIVQSLMIAKCDLGRWMAGWGWWGHDLSDDIVKVLDQLDGGVALKSEEEYITALQLRFPVQ